MEHLFKIAAKPEEKNFRDRIITVWKTEGDRFADIREMTPLLRSAQDWQTLADAWFLDWQSFRYDAGKLYRSGLYLAKAGREEEGRSRMEAAPFMTLMDNRGSGWGAPDDGDPENALKQRIALAGLVIQHLNRYGFDTTFAYPSTTQKYSKHYLKAGRLKPAAYLWSAGHLSVLRNSRYGKHFWSLNNGMHLQEILGKAALKEGRLDEAESRLAKSWRLSIEPTELGAALVKHYQNSGNEKEALRVYETFRDKLLALAAEMPGDPRFLEKLSEWQKVTGYSD